MIGKYVVRQLTHQPEKYQKVRDYVKVGPSFSKTDFPQGLTL